jgi:hypothetical protein
MSRGRAKHDGGLWRSGKRAGYHRPLECKTLIEPLPRNFVLTDVVLELYNHPNGDQSKASGMVWNALDGHWSRPLVGGTVDDRGRRYHFETGILCPQHSRLSVCAGFFIDQPTSLLWAALSGYYCRESHHVDVDLDTRQLQTIDWTDLQRSNVIDPIDPPSTGLREESQDMQTSLAERMLLGTARDSTDRRELWVAGVGGRSLVQPGATVAVRLDGPAAAWVCGDQEAITRFPDGTNLVVVRRSIDGYTSHWICYHEEPHAASEEESA